MKRLLPLFAFLLALTACAPAAASPTPDAARISTQTAATVLAELTSTAQSAPSETPTARPSETPTTLPSATPTPAPSATPAPLARYAEMTITRAEYRSVGGMALTIKLPGIAQPLNLDLGGIKLTCTYDTAYPDTLFCTGLSSPPLDTRLPITFIDPVTGRVDYQGTVILRQSMFPTPTPISPAGNWCPDRGKKVEVEWECRIYDNNPCVVATVYDACGYWYSVHSCPDNMELPSPNCSAEQFAAMRKLYGFP